MSERARMFAAIAIVRLTRGFDAMQLPLGRSCAVFSLILADTKHQERNIREPKWYHHGDSIVGEIFSDSGVDPLQTLLVFDLW